MTYSEMDLDILPTLAEGPRRICCRRGGRPTPPLTVSSSSKALSPPPPPTKADRTFRRQPPSSSPIFLFSLSRWRKTWERSESGPPFPPTFFYLFLRERKIAPFPTFSLHLQGEKNLLPPVVTSLRRRRRAANGLARGVRSKKALRYLLSSPLFSPFRLRRRRANGRSLMWEGIRRGPKEDEPFFFSFSLRENARCVVRGCGRYVRKRVLSLRRSSGDCHSIFSSSLLLRRGKKRAWEGERRRKEGGDTSTPISASFPPNLLLCTHLLCHYGGST